MDSRMTKLKDSGGRAFYKSIPIYLVCKSDVPVMNIHSHISVTSCSDPVVVSYYDLNICSKVKLKAQWDRQYV